MPLHPRSWSLLSVQTRQCGKLPLRGAPKTESILNIEHRTSNMERQASYTQTDQFERETRRWFVRVAIFAFCIFVASFISLHFFLPLPRRFLGPSHTFSTIDARPPTKLKTSRHPLSLQKIGLAARLIIRCHRFPTEDCRRCNFVIFNFQHHVLSLALRNQNRWNARFLRAKKKGHGVQEPTNKRTCIPWVIP